MKEESLNRLFFEIQDVREEMIYVANVFGYTHERTIRISQELDQLINEYQKHLSKPKRKTYVYSKVPAKYRKVLEKTLQLQFINLLFILPNL
ncbi:aspartyl-phosphate phosphatase Spo0E family protein [Bacillus massiliigorillae]|uniref:aspartyl-phosphate phosphatase Spo0E family protein n=1 Tax=Bacillus massiliigorillae TaxID=1243664 RepID=UPI00039F3CA5|nr:aspartyl-phosphate phosphatase Spo0E family protein [Bacillus massiliigorillae]